MYPKSHYWKHYDGRYHPCRALGYLLVPIPGTEMAVPAIWRPDIPELLFVYPKRDVAYKLAYFIDEQEYKDFYYKRGID
jgi:hypothetical protein